MKQQRSWLPMKFSGGRGGGKFSREEWAEYRHRRAQHVLEHPDYDTAWRRPDPATAEGGDHRPRPRRTASLQADRTLTRGSG